MDFVYDAMGNRIEKRVYAPGSVQKFWEHEYYVRDAQGNVMAVYNYKPVFVNGITKHKELNLSEHAVYGSSRCRQRYEAGENADAFYSPMSTANGNYVLSLKKGLREYELNNHLGNVLSVVSDRKLPRTKALAPTVVHEYVGEVLSSSDYAAFGAPLDGRVFNVGNYRYGFNGQEKDDEVKGSGNWYSFSDYGYDSRLNRRPRPDPHGNNYPSISPYAFAANNPIIFIDPDGKDIILYDESGKRVAAYKPGMEPTTGSKLVNETINALNAIHKVDNAGNGGPSPKEIIDYLVNRTDTTIKIIANGENAGDTKFTPQVSISDRLDGNITYDPMGGAEVLNKEVKGAGEGDKISPTTILAHELKHGYNYISNKKKYNKDVSTRSDPNFKNDEEKNATTTTERDVAKSRNEGVRTEYKPKQLKYYKTKSSTTTEPLNKPKPNKGSVPIKG